jgi:hypothetical protein
MAAVEELTVFLRAMVSRARVGAMTAGDTSSRRSAGGYRDEALVLEVPTGWAA